MPEIALHFAIAIDVGLGHFPIIDAGIAGRAGVAEHDAAIEIVKIHRNRDAPYAGRSQFDGADAAVQRRVVILHARGHANDLRFHVLRNLADLFQTVAGSR